jgi:hypothetical protein
MKSAYVRPSLPTSPIVLMECWPQKFVPPRTNGAGSSADVGPLFEMDRSPLKAPEYE